MKLEAVQSASKKFLRTREALFVFPNIQAFSRLIAATIELHEAMVPEGSNRLTAQVGFGIWRLVLTVVGDVTLFWKRLVRS